VYPGPYQRRRPPMRRRRRHSHKVYVRRQIVALVAAIAFIFVVLLGLDHLVHVAFPSHHNASVSKSDKHHKTSPVTVPPTSTTTVDAPAGGNAVTISAVGDTMLGTEGALPPDPSTYLNYVTSALAEPIVFGNLEGTLTTGGVSKCATGSTDCYAFRDPPSYATYLKDAGFTVLNSANNHSHDYGTQGVTDTSHALTAAGIQQTGLPGQIAVVSYERTKVAFVGFAPYTDTNDLLRPKIAKQLIAKAKTMAPVVIVYMHAGAEGATADHVTGKTEVYDGENRGNPEVFAHDAINDGASVVIASGPHVLRGMEFYNGHLIDYSMGNFAGYNNFSTTSPLNLSGILRFKVSGSGKFISATWVSLLLNTEGQPDVDTTGQAAVFVNQLSSQDFGANAAKIEPTGKIVPAG
jgi:poly-gamma-glutamate capsule biosynthesis protein CapA/YwtB (metallophosphatase superfamily)